MSLWHNTRIKAMALLQRERLDDELDDELRFHLDQQIAQLVDQGMDPAAARTEALRRFGGVERFKEECRDERGVNLVDGLIQDLAYAGRMLANNRGFTALVVVTLALGIGANTAIFSVVNGVLLAPLPYPDGDELILMHSRAPGALNWFNSFSIPEFFELRDRLADEVELVEYHGMSFTLLGHGYPSRVDTGVVSHDFFDVLGVEPQLGRTFVASDERPDAEAVLILSDRYWREQFDADPHVVGRLFEMNDRPHRVIGVLPPMPQYPRENDVYMPSTACPYRGRWFPVTEHTPQNAFRSLTVFGRLQPSGSVDDVREALSEVTGAIRRDHPAHYRGMGWYAVARPLYAALTERARPMLLVLLGTVALVLLVACANTANLMVARVLQRDRELALRAAMGAGRGRLMRQLITESTLLSLAGGILGLGLAAAGLDLLVDFAGRFTARTQDITIDGWVLAFTFVVSLVTGIAAGVLPGLRSHGDVIGALHESGSAETTSGRAALRLRGGLIAAQVALSFVLLIAAGLMVNSFVKLSRVDAGFRVDNVLTARVSPNWSEYGGAEGVAALFSNLLRALEEAPEVISAAVANTVPFAGGQTIPADVFYLDRNPLAGPSTADLPASDAPPAVRSPDAPGEWPVTLFRVGVSADYFDTVGIPVLEGRALTDEDIDSRRPVVLVSESARRRYWGEQSPVGGRIAIRTDVTDGAPIWHTIVGVVGDARHLGLELDAPPVLFASYRSLGGGGQLLVRTTVDATTMSAFIQETAARVTPRQAVGDFRTARTLRSSVLATPRIAATLMGTFAVLALLITLAGIAGVVAFSVNCRTHEIGIRMALGAERRSVIAMVVRQGLSMVALGLAIGVAGALWISRTVASFLFETEPTDPLTFVAVAVVLLVATAAACLFPARRATSIDPVIALRTE